MKNLQDTIQEVTSNQKSIEKKQLIAAIEDKISKEKVLLDNMSEKADKKDTSEDITYIINDRIKKLNERLEIAKSL